MGDGVMTTRIAVVDDDTVLLDLISQVLDERHWTTLAVSESSTALDVLRETRPDVILLDVHLNGSRSGWDILQALKDEQETRNIPVIIWTADAKHSEDKSPWLHSLGVPVLLKPFELDDLFQSLERVLAGGHETSDDVAALSG